MAISDSLAMSSPYGRPAIKPGDDWRARVRERGNTIEPCPTCGGEAEAEPPVDYTRAGERLLVTVHRCPACGPVTQSQAAPPEPVREEPVPMPESQAHHIPDADNHAVPESASATQSHTCECGCGLVPKPGRRFASQACVGRGTIAKMRATKAAKKPQADPEHWAYLTEEQKAARRAEPPEPQTPKPTPPKLCDCGCGRPCRFATSGCAPASILPAVKAYLAKLTPEARLALLDLVVAEAKAAALGVQ